MLEQPVHSVCEIVERVDRTNVVDMVVVDMAVRRRRIALARPLRTARETISERDVVSVEIEVEGDAARTTGVGVAAPLPGWSAESTSRAHSELSALAGYVRGCSGLSTASTLGRVSTPSARFAVSSALLDAAARNRNVPLRRLLDPRAPNSVALNAVVGVASVDATVAAAQRAVREGFETVKLKLCGELDTDRERVAAVRRALPDVAVRLDANGCWTYREARRALEALAPFDIEYLEQPVDAEDLESLAALTSEEVMPIAADEAMASPKFAHRIIEEARCDVVVLKPSVIGAWSDVERLVTMADERSIRVVFTSAIDPRASRFVVAQFAAAWLGSDVACGLATGSFFDDAIESREEFIHAGRLWLGSGDGIGFEPRAVDR